MAYKMTPRNMNKGRHAIGSPIGRQIPNKPSQGASGNYGVGTGRNMKSGARKEMSPSRTPSGSNFLQADSLIRQSPEPFRAPGQPATIPAPTNPTAGGTWRQVMSQPGQHPFRAPGVNPMARSQQMTATGHPQGYSYKGLNPINSGRVTQQAPKRNTDNGAQPTATAKMKSNRDIFVDGLAQYKKWGG